MWLPWEWDYIRDMGRHSAYILKEDIFQMVLDFGLTMKPLPHMLLVKIVMT
jgi:hypothetical protein